jgi:hypothetical protein
LDEKPDLKKKKKGIIPTSKRARLRTGQVSLLLLPMKNKYFN